MLGIVEFLGESCCSGVYLAKNGAMWSIIKGSAMKKFTFGLLSAAALATTILLVRQQKEVESKELREAVPAGETQPTNISLERIRELGL